MLYLYLVIIFFDDQSVLNHIAAGLAPGSHTLTAVVIGVITSSYSFYVVPAPAWLASMREVAVLDSVKGLSLHAPLPASDFFH